MQREQHPTDNCSFFFQLGARDTPFPVHKPENVPQALRRRCCPRPSKASDCCSSQPGAIVILRLGDALVTRVAFRGHHQSWFVSYVGAAFIAGLLRLLPWRAAGRNA